MTELEPPVSDIEAAKEFLLTLDRRKTINREVATSNGLKSVAECWFRKQGFQVKISNDSFLIAARALGFRLASAGIDHSDFFLNVSTTSVVSVMKSSGYWR